MKKVSVIMASYLGMYNGRASNPEDKFIRAVKSFITQTYENKELIIVADGCETTTFLYNNMFQKFNNIKLVVIPKQPIYSGECRNAGLRVADGEIIMYLDNDDVWGKTHMQTIVEQFTDDVDLVYYDDYLVMSADFKQLHKRIVEVRYGSIGTSSISHRNLNDPKFSHILNWWSDGYGHDWVFITTLIVNGMQFKKLEKIPSYLVCHWGGPNQRGDY